MNPISGGTLSGPAQSSIPSIVRKVRAAMAAAALQNAVDTPPWLPPASINAGPGNAIRANTTTYPVGYVFTNAAGTHQFVVRVGGATAAAEPATVTTPLVTAAPYNMGDIVDGAATITWMGPVRVTVANPLAPLVSSGAKPAQLSTAVNFGTAVAYGASNPNMQFTGGTGAVNGGTNTFLTYAVGPAVPGNGSNQVDAAQNQGFGSTQANAVTFMTDAPLIAIDLSTGALSSGLPTTFQLYIEIDGVRLCDGHLIPLVALVAGSGFILLDWRANGGRKPRKIRLCAARSDIGQPSYGRIYVTPQDSIWYPSNPNRFRIAMVGDSLTGGSASSSFLLQGDRASLFANQIGCDDISNLGIGGTGYIANSSGTQLNYAGRMRDLVKLNPDIVYVTNNFNDGGSASAVRVAAVLAYLQAVRGALPNALIMAAGTLGGTNPPGNVTLEADIATGVTQFGDPNTFFIPVATDAAPWETGTGNLGATNGSGNNDIYKGPTDTTHLSLMGVNYAARRDAAAFRKLINSLAI